MKRFSIYLALLLPSLSFASDRVTLDVSSKWDKDRLTVQFKVTPAQELKLNMNAPWSLKLSDPVAKGFEKATYSKEDFKDSLPGYAIRSQVSAKKDSLAKIPYVLTAYSCTKDGAQCFHDVLKGEFRVENIESPSNKNQKR